MRLRNCQLNLLQIWFKVIIAIITSSLMTSHAFAHEISPSIMEVSELSENELSIKLITNLEAIIAEIGVEHDNTDQSENSFEYDRLRALSPEALNGEFIAIMPDFISNMTITSPNGELDVSITDAEIPQIGDLDLARDTIISLQASSNQPISHITFQWVETYGDVILRRIIQPLNNEEENSLDAYYIKAGDVSADITFSQNSSRPFWDVVVEYTVIGFEHILPKGLDHILFVIGLFLLSTRIKTLLWQVTAFTIAHSITLALGLLGLVSISPDIVEPLIALSIAIICLENIMTSKLNIWRPILVFAFGLLHGLGFAGVLSEIGLASSDFAVGLISFNIGVELGQLTVIAICLALVWAIKDKPWYRQRITIPASVIIGLIGVYWTIERVFLG